MVEIEKARFEAADRIMRLLAEYRAISSLNNSNIFIFRDDTGGEKHDYFRFKLSNPSLVFFLPRLNIEVLVSWIPRMPQDAPRCPSLVW